MNWRVARFDALLYFNNHLVANFPSARVRHWFYRNVMKIKMEHGVHILSGLWLDCRGHLSIGENTVINQRCRLDARGGLTIGANVSVSPEVHLLTADHDVHALDLPGREAPVVVGDYVFIGSRAIILPGVTLGRGCAVGAGAVVTREVKPAAIVAGVPAAVIGERPASLNYTTAGGRHFI